MFRSFTNGQCPFLQARNGGVSAQGWVCVCFRHLTLAVRECIFQLWRDGNAHCQLHRSYGPAPRRPSPHNALCHDSARIVNEARPHSGYQTKSCGDGSVKTSLLQLANFTNSSISYAHGARRGRSPCGLDPRRPSGSIAALTAPTRQFTGPPNPSRLCRCRYANPHRSVLLIFKPSGSTTRLILINPVYSVAESCRCHFNKTKLKVSFSRLPNGAGCSRAPS